MFKTNLYIFVALAALLNFGVAEISSNPTEWKNDFNPVIFNGKPSVRGQFPYYALIIADFDHFKIAYSGSLIHPQWVLTAVNPARSYEVHLGALDRENITEPGRVIISAPSAFNHPLIQLHDIALIRLDRPVKLSDTIQTIALETLDLPPNTPLTTMGFGSQNFSDNTLATRLQYATLHTISNKRCAETFPLIRFRRRVTCAFDSSLESSCNGDIGSPLVRENAENPRAPTLVGLNSVGPSVCHLGDPTVFTRVADYKKWIQKTIEKYSK